MLFSIRQLSLVVLFLFVAALAGCKSDPYCQQAISNLRAEKIQLENQYYTLKNQYESDMLRLGQPVPGPVITPMPGGNIEEYIPELGSDLSSMSHQPLINRQITGNGLKEPAIADVSDFIQSIEVNQLSAASDESVRLLIRPLDDRGDVIPVAGDVKVTLLDSQSGASVASYQLDQDQVANLIEDRNGQIPGIHLSLPQLSSSPQSPNLICKLQFRTSTQRVFSSETPVMLGNSGGTIRSIPVASTRTVSRSGEAEISDTPPLNGITVEIGDELNLDSLDSGTSRGLARPTWTPGR